MRTTPGPVVLPRPPRQFETPTPEANKLMLIPQPTVSRHYYWVTEELPADQSASPRAAVNDGGLVRTT